MDYIREELLRQRAALARLLLGASEQTAEQERAFSGGEVSEEDAVLRYGEELFLGSRMLAAGERLRLPRGTARTSAEEQRTAYLALLQELSEAALDHESRHGWAEYGSVRSGGGPEEVPYAMGREKVPEMLQRSGSLRDSGRRYALQNSGVEKAGRGVVERETLLPETQMVTEVSGYSGGETESARDLSRIFQRDARRYDGGFTLY